MILYVATSNPGKLRDFATAASAYPHVTIEPLPGLSSIPAPPEDEPTFQGNAVTKAIYYSEHAPGLLVIADDSGLAVDCLNGAPGVRSARYADDHAFDLTSNATHDARNNTLLLQQLLQHPEPHTARYLCVLATARDGEVLALAEGTVEGEIVPSPRGTSGFGYDPLFYLPTHDRTMAELDPATRLSLSHRGQALQTLLPKITPHTLIAQTS